MESSCPEQQPVTIWRINSKMSPKSKGGRAGGPVAWLLDPPSGVSTAGELEDGFGKQAPVSACRSSRPELHSRKTWVIQPFPSS